MIFINCYCSDMRVKYNNLEDHSKKVGNVKKKWYY